MFERFENASGVAFDCDGCLLDSMKAWRGVEYALIDMTGVEWTQNMVEEMRAAPMSEAAKIFHERHGVMDSNEAVVRFVEDTMLDYYANKSEFRPGARAFFERLREHGIPCCIVSSTPARYLKPAMEHVGIIDELKAIISTQETGISKQDTAIYRLALEKLGSSAESTWGFDDSLYAIHTMNSAGLSTVGTYDADDAGTFEQLSEHATLAIHSFEELLV